MKISKTDFQTDSVVKRSNRFRIDDAYTIWIVGRLANYESVSVA